MENGLSQHLVPRKWGCSTGTSRLVCGAHAQTFWGVLHGWGGSGLPDLEPPKPEGTRRVETPPAASCQGPAAGGLGNVVLPARVQRGAERGRKGMVQRPEADTPHIYSHVATQTPRDGKLNASAP